MIEFDIPTDTAKFNGEYLEKFSGMVFKSDDDVEAGISSTALEWFDKNIKNDWGSGVLLIKVTFDLSDSASLSAPIISESVVWWVEGTHLWFEDEKDAMLFKMVWL